ARDELVFRIAEGGALEWGGNTEALFGIASTEFAANVDELLGRIAASDVEKVRRALHSLTTPKSPRSVSVTCGITLPDGSTQEIRLEAWRDRERGEVLGVVTPAERAERALEHPAALTED